MNQREQLGTAFAREIANVMTGHTRMDTTANATQGSRVTLTFMIAKILMNVRKETIIHARNQHSASTLVEVIIANAHKDTEAKAHWVILVSLISTLITIATSY